MRKNVLETKNEKAIFEIWRKKYDSDFVAKYEELIVDIAKAQADIERLTIEINEEGDTCRSESTGNEYQSPKVCVRSQYQKQYQKSFKLLLDAEAHWAKLKQTDSRAGRKAKTAEEEAMGM